MTLIAPCLRPFSALLFVFTLILPPVAGATDRKCETDLRSSPALTLKQLKERSVERRHELEKLVPRPGFDNLEEQAKIEQVGELGPLALQQMLPAGISFVQTPAPTSVDPIAVDLVDEGRSFPVHVDVSWSGRRTSTAAFISLPRAKTVTTSAFVVGPEHPVVLVHLHGGGTPTATGRNGMSIAKEVSKRGLAVIGVDLPGHGRATRNPEGLETFKQQADWLMEVIGKLVDPRTKVVISGHSWGGSFALFMHRLSQDPKYARIAQYIALSPPIDISLGGSLKEKLEFEQRYQREFERFKDRIAPADFEFQSNLLNNGKDSDVGAYFTNLTDLDFQTPPLSVEEQRQLKPLTVVVGSADGLVYVGREEQFQQALGGLSEPSRFILLGPGTTWKSQSPEDLLPTGHNIFDRYIDGTTIPEVYQLIADTMLGASTSLDTVESTGDPVLDLLDRSFRHYANFFGFREMLKGRVEFVTIEQEARQAVSKRRGQLDEYLRRVDTVESELKKIEEGKQPVPAVQQALDALRSRLNLTENINLKRAQEDLELPPLTPERKVELEAYIREIQAAEEDLRINYADSQYDEDIAELNEQYASLLNELSLSDVTAYKEKLDELHGKKGASSLETRWRSELSRLHQKISEVSKRRLHRYGVAKDARLSAIPAPAGVRDQRSAQRELTVDRSPERRAKLEAFVAEYEAVESAARKQSEDELRERILQIPRPPGVENADHARLLRAEQEAILNYTYAPPGEDELASLARQIGELSNDVFVLESGDGKALSVDKLEAAVKALRVKRSGLLKTWEGLWRGGKLTSVSVAKSERNVRTTLENYKELYFAYEEKKADHLLLLKESGQLTAENILKLTPEIKNLRRKVHHAKQVFFQNRQELEQLRWSEATAGRLQGAPDLVKKATTIAVQLWGEDFARTRRPSTNSLTQALRVEEEYLANRQAQLAERELEFNELRAEYSRRMTQLGHPLPYRVERVQVGALFNHSLPNLITYLRNHPQAATALGQTLAKWESFLSRLRTESQSKDSGGY